MIWRTRLFTVPSSAARIPGSPVSQPSLRITNSVSLERSLLRWIRLNSRSEPPMLVPPDQPAGRSERARSESCSRAPRNRCVISTRDVLKRNVSTWRKCFCSAYKNLTRKRLYGLIDPLMSSRVTRRWGRGLRSRKSRLISSPARPTVPPDAPAKANRPAESSTPTQGLQPPAHLLEQAQRNLLEGCHVSLRQG